MKNSKLIKILSKFPPDMEVCILDSNISINTEDESGTHKDFSVYKIMTQKELKELQEEEPNAKNWIALEFDSKDDE
jgi:hypothetical protein